MLKLNFTLDHVRATFRLRSRLRCRIVVRVLISLRVMISLQGEARVASTSQVPPRNGAALLLARLLPPHRHGAMVRCDELLSARDHVPHLVV